MKRLSSLTLLLFLILGSSPSHGRGGGGCLLEGTPILTPRGPVRIETLTNGSTVLAVSDGRLQPARVLGLTCVKTHEILELAALNNTLRLTPEHPLMSGPGEYRVAKHLRAGDIVYLSYNGSIHPAPLSSVHRYFGPVRAYNLLVNPGGTFIPAGFVVHNKGCFLPDSPVLKPDGTEIQISAVQAGDRLLAFTPEGRLVPVEVRKIIRHEVDEYLLLKTDRQTVKVTRDHPFYVGNSAYKTLEALKVGDTIVAWDGQSLAEQRIVSLHRVIERVPVYNLQTDQPNTFFAGRLAVHNKGGGGGGGFRSSGGSSSGGGFGPNPFKVLTRTDWIVMAVFFIGFALFLVVAAILKGQPADKRENLDFLYSKGDVSRKSLKTERLLVFLSRQDPSVLPEELRKRAESTFRTLQECWEKRDYEPMKPLLMEALFHQHSAQLQGMIRNHEINRLEDLKMERVDLVNVRYTEKPDHREFTALISATVRDYYVDDRTGKFLRGDSSPAKFQEFWTFQRDRDRWLLREIEQAGESDYLKDENFVEMLTDLTIQGIYREAAKEGAAGPWLTKGEGKKADRIERLLNFLVQTDRLWDRTAMLERARQVFMAVYLARESGDPNRIPTDDLFPEVAQDLQRQMRQWESDRLRVEYRNLCLRKAELILVRNYVTQSKDEFTVRIDAHAQKILRKGEKIFSNQEYVTPFEEYWVFGRRLGQWKLKEVLPPAGGKKRMAMENVDEESSQEQLQWYYRQKRSI